MITMCVCELCIVVIYIYTLLKVFNVKLFDVYGNVFKNMLCAGLMFLSVYTIQMLFESPLVSLIIGIIMGVLSYIVLTIIIIPEVVKYTFDIFRNLVVKMFVKGI
jgi:uncharacterized membrane protein